MTKLNQMLALRQDADRVAVTAVAHAQSRFHTADNLKGLDRTYTPHAEDGDVYPSEHKPVQYTVEDVITELRSAVVRQLDTLATIDYANTQAKADVVLDGKPLLEGVPATLLLTIEGKLSEWERLVDLMPVLDPGKSWQPERDPVTGHWIAKEVQSFRTRKVPQAHVLYPATDKHPAQVTPYTTDEREGTWLLVERSGAIEQPAKRQLLERIRRLREAVVLARQEANSLHVEDKKVGETLFGYVFN